MKDQANSSEEISHMSKKSKKLSRKATYAAINPETACIGDHGDEYYWTALWRIVRGPDEWRAVEDAGDVLDYHYIAPGTPADLAAKLPRQHWTEAIKELGLASTGEAIVTDYGAGILLYVID
jgi:hypothetical protein